MQAKVVFQLCVANHNQHFKSEWLSLLRTVVVIRHIYSLENNKCVKFFPKDFTNFTNFLLIDREYISYHHNGSKQT